MSNLTRRQKDFIKNNIKNKSPMEIAKILGVDVKSVVQYIQESKTEKPQEIVKSKKIFKVTVDNIYKFTITDYIIFFIIFFIALSLYVWTMTPGIAAGDCGELTCAVYFLGGAHSPGYPLYCIVGKLFMWFFYPLGRIVYRLTFMSAFMGALTVALSYLFFVKFLGRHHNEDKFSNLIFAKIPAIVSSLYFLVSNDLWAQSIIAEVYTLNSVFLPMMFLIALAYEDRITLNPSLIDFNKTLNAYPNRVLNILYLFYFIFGVSLGDHHIILGYFLPFTFFFLYPFFEDKDFFKIVIATTIAYIFALVIVVYYELPESFDNFAKMLILGLLAFDLYIILKSESKLLKPIIISGLFLILGLMVYIYMPIRSRANAPLDWGNPETFENFINVVTRKQYRGFAQNVREFSVFMKQLAILFQWRLEQWTPFIYIFTFLGLYRLFKLNRKWFYFTVSFLFYYDIAFAQFNNFKFTSRDMFFAKVFFIPSYMINIFWILIGVEYSIVLVVNILKNYLGDEIWSRSRKYVASGIFVIFFSLSYLPFKANFDENNAHNCWANDNYGKNLLKTVEYKGILFTEGGDNQVFSLLYHNYIEYLRPDMNDPNVRLEELDKRGIFDQKGNVFLLYGDMMRMTPGELTISQITNDYARFRTGRPIYYTWKDQGRLNEINKLYMIDKYIFDNYNESRKEQIIKNVIKMIKDLNLTVLDYLRRTTKQINPQTPDDEVRNIAIERINLVERERENLKKTDRFTKYKREFEYRQTGILYRICNRDEIFNFPINYWLYYDFEWQEHSDEAVYWDYLTREIIANYNFQMGDEYLAKAYENYNISQNFLISEQERKKAREKFEEFQRKAFSYYREAKKYGFDMTAIHFNYALLLEQLANIYQGEGKLDLVKSILEDAGKSYLKAAEIENRQDNAPRAFFAAGRVFERQALIFPENEITYMSNALKYYKEALEILPNYNEALMGVKRAEAYLRYPTKKIREMEKNLNLNPQQENLYFELVRAYIDRFQYNDAVRVLENGVRAMPNSMNLILNLGNLYTQLNRLDDAIKIWNRVLAKNPNEINSLFYLGECYFRKRDYKKAFENYQKFVNIASGINNQQIQQMVITAHQRMRSISPYLTNP